MRSWRSTARRRSWLRSRRGFNLAGYLVPGAAITAAGAALIFLIGRRQAVAAEAPAEAAQPLEASPEEMERLRRALADVED